MKRASGQVAPAETLGGVANRLNFGMGRGIVARHHRAGSLSNNAALSHDHGPEGLIASVLGPLPHFQGAVHQRARGRVGRLLDRLRRLGGAWLATTRGERQSQTDDGGSGQPQATGKGQWRDAARPHGRIIMECGGAPVETIDGWPTRRVAAPRD